MAVCKAPDSIARVIRRNSTLLAQQSSEGSYYRACNGRNARPNGLETSRRVHEHRSRSVSEHEAHGKTASVWHDDSVASIGRFPQLPHVPPYFGISTRVGALVSGWSRTGHLQLPFNLDTVAGCCARSGR